MARYPSALALALLIGACGGDAVEPTSPPDATSSVCATSADCAAGHWCNPKSVDQNPADTICEPRASALLFDADIYPELHTVCEGCHVPGVLDPKDPKGLATISVFSGGPDVAYASLVAGGTNCATTPHKLCVDEPKNGTAVTRLIAHMNAGGSALLLGAGYGDPWLQKLLHWTAAGAHRTNHDPDAGVPDAPVATADAPLSSSDAPIVPVPDAPGVPDARPPRPDAPFLIDALVPPPGQPTIVSPTNSANTGAGQIPVNWTAAAPNGSPITHYAVTAERVAGGALTTVTCTAPFSNPPCSINVDESISATITGLDNCTAYDVTVTATNANGSTTSDTVLNVTPRQAPGIPTVSGLEKVANSVGELLFSWNAASSNGCGAVSYTVELTPPSGFTCGQPATSPCLNAVGTATSFDMVTTVPACDYPNVNCSSPRTWSFRVRASTSGGTGAFSGAIAGTPRVGFVRDAVPTIFNTNFPPLGHCVDCHVAQANPLVLNANNATTYANLINTANVVFPGNAGASFLHLCPTQSAGCMPVGGFTSHPGGMLFAADGLEDKLIKQWIDDGALF